MFYAPARISAIFRNEFTLIQLFNSTTLLSITSHLNSFSIRHIALKYPDAAEVAKNQEKWKKEVQEDGSVLVHGPDASKWVFINGESENGKEEPFYKIVFSSSNVERGTDFYTNVGFLFSDVFLSCLFYLIRNRDVSKGTNICSAAEPQEIFSRTNKAKTVAVPTKNCVHA